MCSYPQLIKNPKYKKNAKNGGIIPPIRDARVTYLPIGCGQCRECTRQRAREWQIRLLEEIRNGKTARFITLTFSNESIKKLTRYNDNLVKYEAYELDTRICIDAVKLWRERWRKHTGKSIRHWLITELGHRGTEHIHMHGIIWTEESTEFLTDTWQYGYVWPREGWRKNYVNARTVNYVMKYVTKIDLEHRFFKSRILASPGIGSGYIERRGKEWNKYNGTETHEDYVTQTRHRMPIPIYWRNKIYSEEERELLWLNKLDREYRYVSGQRVRTDNHELIGSLIAAERHESNKLGYGGNTRAWSEEAYERQKRQMKIEERIWAALDKNDYPKEWDT